MPARRRRSHAPRCLGGSFSFFCFQGCCPLSRCARNHPYHSLFISWNQPTCWPPATSVFRQTRLLANLRLLSCGPHPRINHNLHTRRFPASNALMAFGSGTSELTLVKSRRHISGYFVSVKSNKESS